MIVIADFLDFYPLFNEDESTVRARLDADANAGLLPDDEDYVDTRQTQFFYITTQPFVIEMARAYDEMSTRMAAGFLPFAWGQYLDYHGLTLNVPRKVAVAAEGTLTITGTNGTVIPVGMQVAPTAPDPSINPPVFQVTASGTIAGGTVDVPIEALEPGTSGNVAIHALQSPNAVIVTPAPAGITGFDNAAPTAGGTDVESDDDYKQRMMAQYTGVGPGNIADYKRWALAWPGVGRVSVQANWAGPGTVRVVLMNTDGSPVAAGTIAAFQTWVDPIAGQAAGYAPPGAIVTVVTSAPTAVNVTATVAFESGYSLDGTSGTTALRTAIQDTLTEYIDGLDVGQTVVKNHVEAQFFRVQGVHDVTVTVPAADVTINGAATPPQIATIGVITLS